MTTDLAARPSDAQPSGADPAPAALAALWQQAGLPPEALAQAQLPGREPVLPSAFAVATAAQASLGAAALAAAELWHLRRGGPRQTVRVDRRHAVVECGCHFTVDGVTPPAWDPLSGLYRCGDAAGAPGWVRIHANFAHHRDGALRLLGCPAGPASGRAQVAAALRSWRAEAFEDAAAAAGLAVAAARSLDAWDAHPQGRAVAAQPVLRIEPLDDGRASAAPPLPWPTAPQRPLAGLRVLELTRILAGPVAARTLAAHGAEVMLVNSPRLPNIAAIAETSRGKLSTHLDLDRADDRAALQRLLADAHVFLQGYRPGALAARGFGAAAVAALRPGIVVAQLSAYGPQGPWRARRGFDSLVQTATGLNLAEAQAFGAAEPRALPLQILDYAAGHLLAFGIQAALWRQATQGGSWQVQVSLAGVGHWLRGLGRMDVATAPPPLDAAAWLREEPSGFGRLGAVPHAAQLSHTPSRWTRPSVPPGAHAPVWPPL